jgi:hypothetical protein
VLSLGGYADIFLRNMRLVAHIDRNRRLPGPACLREASISRLKAQTFDLNHWILESP